MLRAAGLRGLRWLDPPPADALAHAEELLTDLDALKDGAITDLGRRMLDFPLHPRYARMLIAAKELGCAREASLAAALTQGRDLLTRDADRDRFGGDSTSDFTLLMRAWKWAADHDFRLEDCRRVGVHAQTARQVERLFGQFLEICGEPRRGTWDMGHGTDALRRCILAGFSDRVARRLDEGTLRCELVHNRRGTLARESVVRSSPLLVVADITEVEGKKVDTLLSLATAIEPSWLRELNERTFVDFDAGPRRVTAHRQVRFRDLVIESKEVEPPADAAAKLLAMEVVAGRLRLVEWDDAVEQWILRVNLLAKTCPELGIAAIGEEERREIVAHVCHGAVAYKEIKDKPVKPVVMSWLGPAQRELVEKHAPERLKLANGRTPKVTYTADGASIAAKIQDLYDVPRVPPIAMGRVAPAIQILAPNQRPVQVTQDLAAFWRDHYPRVKKELQRKYPKHEWR
jgi:ATP-dependent helicase HrpB